MVERQPTDANRFWRVAESLLNQGRVGEQVAVRDHDAPRGRGRARRVLQEGEAVWRERRLPPLGRKRIAVEHFGGLPGERRESRLLGQHFGDERVDVRRAEDRHRPRVVDHRPQPAQAARSRRIRRDRDGAGVQAAKERCDKLEPRRVEKQHPLAFRAKPLQRRADGASLAVQTGIRQPVHFIVVIIQECGGLRAGLRGCSGAEHRHKIFERERGGEHGRSFGTLIDVLADLWFAPRALQQI